MRIREARPPRALTRAEVREVDRRAIEELGVPGLVLMENAGLGLTQAVLAERASRGFHGAVAIACGRGNNGGDGFVLARQLELRGVRTETVYVGGLADAPRGGDAGTNLGIVERAGWSLGEAPDALALRGWLARARESCDLVVDAVYGTGLSGELRPEAREVVEALDACGLPLLAVDIPSGLDCDTGVPLGVAVRAIRTVTFVAEKQGFLAPGAWSYTGPVEVVPIGCPPAAWAHVT
ncbi:MAG: NAD(P)H-hydrate epimerase [Planctomycetota bacterium]